MTKAQTKLVNDNLKLVTHVILKRFKYMLNRESLEELQSRGNVGLVLAALRFDESKGFAFSTYAVSLISGALQTAYRDKSGYGGLKIPRSVMEEEFSKVKAGEQSSLPGVSSLEQLMNPDGESEATTLDIPYIVDYYDTINFLDLVKRIEECIEEDFQGKQKDLLHVFLYDYIYFGLELTQNEIAERVDTSQPNVARVLKEFRKALTARGITVKGAKRT